MRVASGVDRQEWIVLNAGGKTLKAGALATDARQLYLDVRKGSTVRGVAVDATYVTLDGKYVLRQHPRRTWEKAE